MKNFKKLNVFYTKEELDFREKVHEFAENRIKPFNNELENNNYEPIKKLIREMGKEKILGALHPKKYGGIEMGMIGETIVAEEIARVSLAVDLSMIATIALFGMPLQRFGTEE
ncbi:MAG: acyl-CoA dehydrogenase family protein [Candidatus Helarchaeota archaeon]